MTSPAAGDCRCPHLAARVMHFARLLRDAGLAVGPGQVLDAVSAVAAVGVRRPDDFYWALHAALVSRPQERAMFAQAFRLFWLAPRAESASMPGTNRDRRGPGGAADPRETDPRQPGGSRRFAQALAPAQWPASPGKAAIEIDAALTCSAREAFHHKDFEAMTGKEARQATELIERMVFATATVPTRRFAPDPRGPRLDVRAMMRASLRAAGREIPLAWRAPRRRPPPLVVLCDVSGSMGQYTRMFLCFLHALAARRDRVHAFVFATELTCITSSLRHRDPGAALAVASRAVRDWSGGTRIGACLAEFQARWARRVLGARAIVLLISDGLDGDAGRGLERQAQRLARSCRRLIWLNPLLRHPGFEPLALGIKALLPHVDDVRPVHNLASLASLAELLGKTRAAAPRRPRRR